MLKIVMIRHFATQGNLQKRYVGSTDEPLCEEGKEICNKIIYPNVDAVFASPMKRCLETARLIYPGHQPVIYEGWKECNFGDFENKNHKELEDNPEYQVWVDSGGTLPFPNGEDPSEFKLRCVKTFEKMVETSICSGYRTVAMVVHGGTIMSVLEKYSETQEDYFHWQTDNGMGYIGEIVEKKGRLTNLCTIP